MAAIEVKFGVWAAQNGGWRCALIAETWRRMTDGDGWKRMESAELVKRCQQHQSFPLRV